MFNILLILLGGGVIFAFIIFVSIYRDYRVNKKMAKKKKRSQMTRKEEKELRERVRNVARPPWIRNRK